MTSQLVQISTTSNGNFGVRAERDITGDFNWQTAFKKSLQRRVRGAKKVRLSLVDSRVWTYSVVNAHGGVLASGEVYHDARR